LYNCSDNIRVIAFKEFGKIIDDNRNHTFPRFIADPLIKAVQVSDMGPPELIMPVIKFLEHTAQYIRVQHGFFRLEQMRQTFIIFIMILFRINQNSEFIRVMIHHQSFDYIIDDMRRINLIIAVYQRMARFFKFIAEYLIINSLSNYKLEIIFAQLKAARRKHFAERNMNRVLQREFDSYIARAYDRCNDPEAVKRQIRTKMLPKPGDVAQSECPVQLNSETAYYSVCFIVKYFRRN